MDHYNGSFNLFLRGFVCWLIFECLDGKSKCKCEKDRYEESEIFVPESDKCISHCTCSLLQTADSILCSSIILLRMLLMLHPVVQIYLRQILRFNDQYILRILFLVKLKPSVLTIPLQNDHDLVVGGRTLLI